MKRIIILVLSTVLIFTSISITAADEINSTTKETIMDNRFIGLYRATSSIGITNNTANCKATAFAKTTDYSLYVILSLQKKSGANWNNIISWSDTGSGLTGVVLSKTKSSLSSGTYRCKVYVRVYNSNGTFIESTTVYSQPRSI